MCVCAYLCLVCVPVESTVTRLCADVTVHMHVIGGSREERMMITCSVIGLSALISFDLFYYYYFFFLSLLFILFIYFFVSCGWRVCCCEIVIGRCGCFVVFVEFRCLCLLISA